MITPSAPYGHPIDPAAFATVILSEISVAVRPRTPAGRPCAMDERELTGRTDGHVVTLDDPHVVLHHDVVQPFLALRVPRRRRPASTWPRRAASATSTTKSASGTARSRVTARCAIGGASGSTPPP